MATMRYYRGDANGTAGSHTVMVYNDDELVGPLRHIVRHSPTGFSWGYGGSGPADLARCLLIDHLGDDARCVSCAGVGQMYYAVEAGRYVPLYDENDPYTDEEVESIGQCFDCDGDGIRQMPYQAFKFDVIARLDREHFELSSADIDQWLSTRPRLTWT